MKKQLETSSSYATDQRAPGARGGGLQIATVTVATGPSQDFLRQRELAEGKAREAYQGLPRPSAEKRWE